MLGDRFRIRNTFFILGLGLIAVFIVMNSGSYRSMLSYIGLRPRATTAARLREYGPAARARLMPYFKRAGVTYPPSRLTLVALKEERDLHVYAANERKPRFIRSYKVLASSGRAGPKLKEGDRQVPEGIYQVESLNPNSAFHLSLRLNYPNAFDRQQAIRDGRQNLGGDIMIHGSRVSIGCLAVGDEGAEDLFVLAADTGLTNVDVIITPLDMRSKKRAVHLKELPQWVPDLYRTIERRLRELPLPIALEEKTHPSK